jgi:nicotinamide-nucleotide amidase
MAHAPTIAHELVQRAGHTIKALATRKLSVITAESCTAGLIAAALSRGDGASDVLEGGFVVYTKGHKAAALGVDAGCMDEEGCVTEAVVRQMAEGALARSSADIALAVSGVLGPEPDQDGNPVGLVYFCCVRRGSAPHVVREEYPAAPHDELRRTAVLEGLRLIEAAALG